MRDGCSNLNHRSQLTKQIRRNLVLGAYYSIIVICTMVHWYIMTAPTKTIEVERVQTGVRLEKRLLKVLKALAELKDMTLGDLLEGIILHSFEGKSAFSPSTLKEIEQFKKLYGMTLSASDSHHLKERR